MQQFTSLSNDILDLLVQKWFTVHDFNHLDTAFCNKLNRPKLNEILKLECIIIKNGVFSKGIRQVKIISSFKHKQETLFIAPKIENDPQDFPSLISLITKEDFSFNILKHVSFFCSSWSLEQCLTLMQIKKTNERSEDNFYFFTYFQDLGNGSIFGLDIIDNMFYIGQMANDFYAEGKGELVDEYGNIYFGGFDGGLFHGVGALTNTLSGGTFVGQFNQDCKVFGRETQVTGGVYQGQK